VQAAKSARGSTGTAMVGTPYLPLGHAPTAYLFVHARARVHLSLVVATLRCPAFVHYAKSL